MDSFRQTFWNHHEQYIPVFGADHLLYMGILLILLAWLVGSRNRIRHNPEPLRRAFFWISLLQQSVLYFWYALETGFDPGEALPLHICRISTLLGIVYLVNKHNRLMDVVFYFGLYAYGSFLYPSLVYSLQHVIGWSFLVNHAITILLPFFAYFAYDWRPERSGLRLASTLFLGYFLIVYLVNPWLDGNYFYLKQRPFFETMPEAIYVPVLIFFTLFIFWLGYKLGSWLIAYNERKSRTSELKQINS